VPGGLLLRTDYGLVREAQLELPPYPAPDATTRADRPASHEAPAIAAAATRGHASQGD
jgi:hypothetical protein